MTFGVRTVRHMQKDGYHVIDWRGDRGFPLTELWQRFPELVLGRFLVNTSFDSGFLALSKAEQAAGWRMVGQLAHSPPIQDLGQVPHDQFDEWLVFDCPTQISEFDSMVNYSGFSPIAFGWEEKLEIFWEQVLRLRPSHVMGENDGMYLVSRDEKLVRKIMSAESGAGSLCKAR